MTKRREFSQPVAKEIMTRVQTPTGFRCEACGAIVAKGEIDHVIAEGLIRDKSKKLTATDGQFLCWPCHQGPDGKTPKDKAVIAKAKRQEAYNLGIRKASKRPIQSAGFRRFERPALGAERIDKSVFKPLPRRNPLTGETIE